MSEKKKDALIVRPQSQILNLSGFAEAERAAERFAGSNLVPASYRGKPNDVLVCWQYGAEVGLPPMQALQSVAVINGKPALYGDGLLAVAQSHPEFSDMIETCSQNVATCTVKRRGRADTVRTFGENDARSAGLWGKQGPWSSYPQRMLQMRARGFALRDAFADALKGFKTVEELQDIPEQAPEGDPRGGVYEFVRSTGYVYEQLTPEQQKRAAAAYGKKMAETMNSKSGTEKAKAALAPPPEPEIVEPESKAKQPEEPPPQDEEFDPETGEVYDAPPEESPWDKHMGG